MTSGIRSFIAAALLIGATSSGGAAPGQPSVETMYADAVSKEVAIHTALADPQVQPTVLRAVHTVVGDYEAIVRTYPTSAYCDDALWRAGLVSIDAFKKFGDARDKDAAIRLLGFLSAQYPASKLAKNVPEVLRTLDAVASRQSAVASQSPVASQQSPVSNQQPSSAGRPTAPARVATITAIHRVALPDAVRVTVDLDAEVPFHEERIDGPSRIFIDFSPAKPAGSLQEKTLRFDGDADPVRQVRIGQHDAATRVVLDALGVRSYSVYPLYNPYRLVIDCVRAPAEAAPAAPTQTMAAPPRPAASPVRAPARQAPPALKGRTLVSDFVFPLATGSAASAATFQRLFEPEGLESANLSAAAPASLPAPPAATPDRNLAGGFSIARQLGLGVSRIVIDPGHGGHDPGAKKNGVSEAELVLDVALRLEKLLQKGSGMEVILTRRTDDFVALEERTAIANREGADLFLSIHANASQNELARGIETYYLNFASNLDSAAVAARENAASGHAMGEVPDFVKSIALNNKLDESREFATDVQTTMVDKLKASNRTVKDLGVKQAPFMVLIGAAMPSVLAEISFLTNEPEAKLLKSSSYRDRIAEALYAAVRKYQTSLKGLQTVAR